jgi:protein CpxP
MTTRFKVSLAAALAVMTMATAAPVLIAVQDQPQHRQGPPPGGGPRGGVPGGIGGRGPMGGPMGPMGFGPGFRALDLTDDQKAQLKSIADSHRDEFRAAGEKVQAAREGMRPLIESDSINESAIRAKSAEIASAEADVMILNAKVRQESMQVLTSEQQAKLKELRDSRPGPMQRRPRGQR